MEKPREKSVQSWKREFKEMETAELEALLADIELRERQAVRPLTRQKAAVQSVIRKRLALVVANAPRELEDNEEEAAGLPDGPVIAPPDDPIGDINLLMNTVSLIAPPFDRILIGLAQALIRKTGGVAPSIEIKPMRCGRVRSQRIVAKWTVPRTMSVKELLGIERITGTVYERSVSGHRKESGGWEQVIRYVDLENKAVAGREGIYFGTSSRFDSESLGVVVSRKFSSRAEAQFLVGAHREDWIARSIEGSVDSTEIELREGSTDKNAPALAQDKFIELVVQLSYLLARQRLIKRRVLVASIYRELNRVGTTSIEREKLYGMRSTLSTIERVLILPLQCPNLAQKLRFEPESVLLVGVPGNGKTFLAHFLMTGAYNAIFAAFDSDRLRQNLIKSGEDGASSILLHVDGISKATGLPVICTIDDIDVILEERADRGMVSKFLNLMQGIRRLGLYILASTNYPEKIDVRLLEPGRFTKIIHVGLPNEEDRAGVITNHLAGLPFSSESAKQDIIQTMSRKTDGWTQRYLKELCMEAGRLHALEVAKEFAGDIPTGHALGPLSNRHFSEAYAGLMKGSSLKDVRDWDRRIADFVSRSGREYGYL